ncbi:MAG: TPM domain-containing protein [Clostridia bacterium]|nr:TPM domain-containing protein [Clostridia bacterium]
MVKRIAALLLLLMLVPIFAMAERPAVVDDAGLFTDSQIERLERIIHDIRTKYQMDAVVLTTNDVPYGSDRAVQDYADLWYERNGYGMGPDDSGFLYMIDMHNRMQIISTSGMMIDYINDNRRESLLDTGGRYLSAGRYGNAAIAVMEQLGSMLAEGRQKGQFRYDAETGKRLSGVYNPLTAAEMGIAAAAGIAAAFIFAGSVSAVYSLKGSTYRYNAAKAAQRSLSQDDVRFTHETVTRVRKAEPSSRGGGGGFGGGGGMGSSVHRSSSGRSHGGGGRHF